MSDHDHDHFEQTNAGASKTYPVQAGALKKNHHAILSGHPCKIVDYSTSKTGKHGHAKARIVGIDIFTGKKYEDIAPTGHSIEVPVITRSEYQLIDITGDNYMSLIDKDGNTKDDLMLPEGEIGEGIRGAFDAEKDVTVTVIAAMDQEGVSAFKEA